MKLKCSINGIEYDLVQGVTFADEYNETLDSGNIILDQVNKIEDLQPYDDVFIYSADSDDPDFDGYNNSNRETKTFWYETLIIENKIRFKYMEMRNLFRNGSRVINQSIGLVTLVAGGVKNVVNAYFTYNNDNTITMTFRRGNIDYSYQIVRDGNTNYMYLNYSDNFILMYFDTIHIVLQKNNVSKPSFYKHLLVYQFSEERVNPVQNIYKYVIELCSETKKLETIQLPNISVTQPLELSLKKSVYDYIIQFFNLYNPKIKMALNDEYWKYQGKYTLDANNLYEIYGNVYCPDFSLDNPSLKDVLHQLFLTKDRIPYVKDDVIYALDITARTGDFSLNNITSIRGSRSYENHADNLKRTYTNALSGKNTARRVEYLGFRNSDNALMTIDNMRVETQFPIYKINKFYMCYYKKAHIYKDNQPEKDMIFLCKQDITDLVKLEQERQVLSKDWNDFNNNPPSGSNCIEEMAQYKLCTVGYSIGGNTIEGWGTMYKYPKGWWDISATYIENIFKIIDKNKTYGIYTYGYITQHLEEGEYLFVDASENPLDNLVSVFTGSSRLKSFFFMVDYEAFYNGTVITSKDVDRDDIVINDNSSSSLTLLEKDGLFQKEKANRFGNMAYTIEAIYDSVDEVQELGSVYDDDIIIYHREYSIFEKYVKAIYYGTKDYVLKNYYTSVYAKHRPYALMDYGQSVRRSENRKLYVMIAKNKLYYEDRLENDLPIDFNNFGGSESGFSYLKDIMSFETPSLEVTSIDRFVFDKKINYAFIEYDNEKYACDMNTFVNGYSLCFNVSMNDNISAGNYIKVASPTINPLWDVQIDGEFTGSIQDFYPIVDNMQTGFTRNMSIWATHISQSDDFGDNVFDDYVGSANDLYEKIFALPKLQDVYNQSNMIGGTYDINKDNKEVIDMTFQIEAYTNDKDVLFSEWMLKLSDLNGVYNKVSKDYTIVDVASFQNEFPVYYGTAFQIAGTNNGTAVRSGASFPLILFKIPKNIINTLTGKKANSSHIWGNSNYNPEDISQWTNWYMVYCSIVFESIVSINDNELRIKSQIMVNWRHGLSGGNSDEAWNDNLLFTKITKLGSYNLPDTENYNYYCSVVSSHISGTVDEYSYSPHESYWIKGQFDDGNIYYSSNFTTLVDDYIYYADPTGQQKEYYKNMNIVLSEEPLKKTLVYDEYSIMEVSVLNVTDIITEVVENHGNPLAHDFVNKIRVDLSQIANTTKSVQMWFYDEEAGAHHFVFGVNVNEDDFTRGYVDIYLSSISKKDTRVYNSNHIMVGHIMNFAEDDNKEKYGLRQEYVLEYE